MSQQQNGSHAPAVKSHIQEHSKNVHEWELPWTHTHPIGATSARSAAETASLVINVQSTGVNAFEMEFDACTSIIEA